MVCDACGREGGDGMVPFDGLVFCPACCSSGRGTSRLIMRAKSEPELAKEDLRRFLDRVPHPMVAVAFMADEMLFRAALGRDEQNQTWERYGVLLREIALAE